MKIILSTVVLLVFCGTGCLPESVTKNKIFLETPTANQTWNEVASGISRYECDPKSCGVRFILYRFDTEGFTWHFAKNSQPATVEGWAKSLPRAVFVVNGVYFDEKWQPTGMLKAAGELTNNRTYDLDRSGLLVLAPKPEVIDTATKNFDINKATEAGQSFPLLIKNGVPVSTFKDTHEARRSIIGTDKKGNTYVGTVPEDGVTFANLSTIIAGTGVEWKNVLNLDGGTSTGFAVRAGKYTETMNSIVQVPNVIVAERK